MPLLPVAMPWASGGKLKRSSVLSEQFEKKKVRTASEFVLSNDPNVQLCFRGSRFGIELLELQELRSRTRVTSATIYALAVL